MPRRRLTFRPTNDPQGRNDLADLPCVKRLADVAVAAPIFFNILCNVCIGDASRSRTGFTVQLKASLEKMLASLAKKKSEYAKQAQTAIEAFGEIVEAFQQQLIKESDEAKANPAGRMAAAIAERITEALLLSQDRLSAKLVRDAHVYVNDKRINLRNLDFVFPNTLMGSPECYECKNNPYDFFWPYEIRNDAAKVSYWRSSQVHLCITILEVDPAAHIGVVCLRPPHVVSEILKRLIEIPDGITVYDQNMAREWLPYPALTRPVDKNESSTTSI